MIDRKSASIVALLTLRALIIHLPTFAQPLVERHAFRQI